MSAQPFDRDTYRRDKLLRLERDNAQLRTHRERCERVIALLAVLATKGTACRPLDLVAVLEEMVVAEVTPRRDIPKDEFLTLLRAAAA